ncbi:hypothetical protein HYX19_00600 [Candidatus Woesearchaeota archaeon]|nr:hypothetical protein [Candidatus Woesearchaeota archaeon]
MEKNYRLKGNQAISPIIGNLVYDEVGREVLAIHNERFNGINGIEDNYKYKNGQPISFSNVPRVLSYNQILRERFPGMHVLSPEEVVEYWDLIPGRDSTYADTDSIVVYPEESSNEDLRRKALDILGRSKTSVPLVVSGLGVDRKDDEFTFVETPHVSVKEISYLRIYGKISYNPNKGLVSSEKGIPVFVAHSGLGRFYRGRSDWLNAGGGCLLNASESGRVQIVQDSQDRAKNLESMVADKRV